MASPLLLGGALFPSAGFFGLVLTLVLFTLSVLLIKAADLAAIAFLLWGIVHVGVSAPSAPDGTWAMTTYDGIQPVSLMAQFARQDHLKARTKQAIEQGAKLIVLPEGSNPAWDAGQQFYWDDVRRLAMTHHAQVLIGVYTSGLLKNDRSDGLYDLTTGTLYPASIPMPIGMWRPWVREPFRENFPLRMTNNILPTRYGPAAYSICYENLLLWPTMVAEIHHPRLMIAAANQWFATGSLGLAQQRSLMLQARLFGLPLINAVNWPDPS
jgi:apolipoprotein N-acyltransferase